MRFFIWIDAAIPAKGGLFLPHSYQKTFVSTVVYYSPEGELRPLKILWRDGRSYTIDRILDVCPAASMKAGGCGTRFTCRIARQITYLFYEEGRWFVEEKCPAPPLERKDALCSTTSD